MPRHDHAVWSDPISDRTGRPTGSAGRFPTARHPTTRSPGSPVPRVHAGAWRQTSASKRLTGPPPSLISHRRSTRPPPGAQPGARGSVRRCQNDDGVLMCGPPRGRVPPLALPSGVNQRLRGADAQRVAPLCDRSAVDNGHWSAKPKRAPSKRLHRQRLVNGRVLPAGDVGRAPSQWPSTNVCTTHESPVALSAARRGPRDAPPETSPARSAPARRDGAAHLAFLPHAISEWQGDGRQREYPRQRGQHLDN